MIQFLADGIDQLDLALDQLAVRDRNFDRFALMLVDNVVELTLHRFAQDRASENELWQTLKTQKYDAKSIDRALGQSFDGKVKLAAKLGLLTPLAAESVLNLHAFRNTAYHRGLRHERILHSLALFYFGLACEILEAYEPRYWSWSTEEALPHRARKYLGDPRRAEPTKVFRAAYKRLHEVAAAMPASLIEDLSGDLQETVESIDNAIEFLATDSPEVMSRDQVIVQSQAWTLAFTGEGRTFARDNGWPQGTVLAYVEWLAKVFPWPCRNDPIPGWRSRLAKLQSEKDEHRALKKYCDFMRQTETIRSALMESATQLDSHIQNEIDRARGK
jgi:hypothetical protein